MFNQKPHRKIDFLLVGAQKSGTSALDKYLREHPEIGMAKRKEVHFFDNEKVFLKSQIDYSEYEINFDFNSNKKIFGEATPIYIYWEPSCRRIWEYNRNIKLIFILRNPITRAFSHWNMEFDRKAEKDHFSLAIRNEYERLKEKSPLQHRVFSYTDRGYYSRQILRYKRLFSEEQMLFIKYEEFKSNNKQELSKIFEFLGVKADQYIFNYKEVHTRKKHDTISIEDKSFLINKLEADIRQVEELLNWDCSDWLV